MQKIDFINNSTPALNATNLNRLQDNIEEAIAVIIESGSNSNGNWIKYTDGTMICWNSITVTDQPIWSPYGSLYQSTRTITYPQTFISAPCLQCSQFQWGTSASWGAVLSAGTGTATIRGIDAISRSTGTNCYISWLAIGKWK